MAILSGQQSITNSLKHDTLSWQNHYNEVTYQQLLKAKKENGLIVLIQKYYFFVQLLYTIFKLSLKIPAFKEAILESKGNIEIIYLKKQ